MMSMPRRSCVSAAVAIAGVLTIGLMTDTLRATFRGAGAGHAELASRCLQRRRGEQLIDELLRQPLFESARRFREPDLAA